jgi:hypothetical protein
MAMPIRMGIPPLEGEVARRFIKEANDNLKKRGTCPIPEEYKVAYEAMRERQIKEGTWPWM